MPRGGSKPGERRGGRVKGVPNKATMERALIAANTLVKSRAADKKLAKEVLDDFMALFAGMAAHYQPTPPHAMQQNQYGNPAEFEKYARLAVQCAKDLAPYQSPTFRAIVVAPALEQTSGRKQTRFTLTIFQDSGHAIAQPKVIDAVPGGD